jgi:hypothetical protein
MGDQYLFPEFDYCMNLGSFRIFHMKMKTLAFDISPSEYREIICKYPWLRL